jgi:hypothetical protein
MRHALPQTPQTHVRLVLDVTRPPFLVIGPGRATEAFSAGPALTTLRCEETAANAHHRVSDPTRLSHPQL